MKKVTLCMMTYNSQSTIKITLDSIAMQSYGNIELSIADGGSTDDTLAIIDNFKTMHDNIEVNCVSEPDNGLYDALNKSIKRASGDYILVMNDQLLGKHAIAKMVRAIEKTGASGCHADLIYADENNVRRFWHMGDGKLGQGWIMGHPTLMVRREIYEKYGLYDTSFKIAADYEFEIRIIKAGEKFAYIPGILVRMFYGGTSTSSLGSYIDSLKEGHRALRNNKVDFALWIDMLRTIRVLTQFVIDNRVIKFWKMYKYKITRGN